MHPLDIFDAIYCINLDRSKERWKHVEKECKRIGIYTRSNFDADDPCAYVRRFSGYDFHEWDRVPEPHLRESMKNALCGCSQSHAALYSIIAHLGHRHTLILEDDFEILHDDFLARFTKAWSEVPPDWDVVYLGAHYGDLPTERLSEHVIRAGYIKTTSSYAISHHHARLMAPIMATCAPPDDTLSGLNPHCNAYVLHPTLIGQYENVSDIWGQRTNNTLCMTDPHHRNHCDQLPYPAQWGGTP